MRCRSTITDARKTFDAATALIREAKSGSGLLATLLNNQALAKDLQALISNMRAHGVLFYRDSTGKPEARAAASPRGQEPARPRKVGR